MARNARIRDAGAYEANLLDAVNLRLLKELQADGRLSVAELGRRISMSAPAVAERVQRPEIAPETPEVAECHRITGEDCYLLKLHLRAIDELEELLDRFTPYGLTTTSIIHSSPVPRRGPPLVP